jgi:hypothetical protein
MKIVEQVWRDVTAAVPTKDIYNVKISRTKSSVEIEYDSIIEEGKRFKVVVTLIGYGVAELFVNGESVWKAKDPENDPVAPGTDSYKADVEGRMVCGILMATAD